MSNNPLGLNRDQLSKALGGNYAVIRAFEQLQLDASVTPSTIEEAAATANSALSVANLAVNALLEIADALDPLVMAPVSSPEPYEEPYVPATAVPIVGTIAEQDAEQVAITGGNIDGTVIGATAVAAGNFSNLVASLGFGCNGRPAQSAFALGDAATDLPTVIALANNIRLALIANGTGS